MRDFHSRRIVIATLAALLAACATATPYRPLADGYGYSERKLESNRYAITFAGNSQTPRQVVEDYLLYRAAEVTLANGYNYFIMADQDTEGDTRYQNQIINYGGFGSYRWGPGFGIGVGTTTARTEYEGQANIVMFKGAKPTQDVKAFDADEIKANLESRITRAAPK